MPTDSKSPDYGALLKQSLRKLEELQGRVRELERDHAEPLAVIGLACRFPGGANDPASFWQLLSNGVEAGRGSQLVLETHARLVDQCADSDALVFARGGFRLADLSIRNSSGRTAQAGGWIRSTAAARSGWEALERAGQSPATLAGSYGRVVGTQQ
jgi:hypothetical protein